ncbi:MULTISPECIES: hypothetical protein [Acinetobacter]|uniref:hypothetical protein n=1 Tax=Acinetobacter TaxID=469 RepID=UPI00101F9C96|nr:MULTISPECIES: hypothetical protein [Acinetobacter]MDM1756812.1 hypothetical protein [Acinetobacter sp. 256-1]MDM1762466.1 hypothetical protein [Acinetobacter sp. 251-1]RYL29397.1 hypothetical protein EWP19_00965 [Acinetobacter piscicola]
MSLNLNNIQTLFSPDKAKLLNCHSNELCLKKKSKSWCIRLIDKSWHVLTLNDGKVIENITYASEYQACLRFLYLCQVITTDQPNHPKILGMDRDYCFAEKNGEYLLEAGIMVGTHGEHFLYIKLNQEEIQRFKKEGFRFINTLLSEIRDINSSYNNSKFSQRNRTDWYVSSQELKAWQELQIIEKPIIIEKPTYQEPKKNGTKIVILLVGFISIFYIIFFSAFDLL